MDICIYTLTSSLHDKQSVDKATSEFLSTISCDFTFKGNDFAEYGSHDLDLIYVRTGGAEGLFKAMLNGLVQVPNTIYLLTSGQSNSLAASMEILSYLRNNNINGEILHGDSDYINQRIAELAQVGAARKRLNGMRLGVVGKPSDWLISSGVDYATVKDVMGITLVDIGMDELLATYDATPAPACIDLMGKAPNDIIKNNLVGAERLYEALKVIVEKYSLNGFTIRCFDLLSTIHNTGCIALAKFNAQGIVATCEGDIPAMLSMAVSQALTGVAGFQANPARINPETGEMLVAHCTIPFNMLERYELDTHFESGIGVAICGYMQPGPITIFKLAGNGARHFAAEGTLLRSQSEPNLCRTQQVIKLADKDATKYFLTNPIGNHHIIIPGHCKLLLDQLFIK